MAQSEQQSVGAAGQGGTAGSKTASESAPSRSGPAEAREQGQGEAGTSSGRAQQEPSGSRLTRREGWDDPLTTFFGGSPFSLFRRLSDDMDRLFFGGGGQGLGTLGSFGGRFLPHIEIDQRGDQLIVRADLPGVRPEDFHVDIEDDALVLQGERKSQQEENRGGVRRSERVYGSFRRVIPLPAGAKVEAAEARFENGELEITVPLQQQAKSRRLQVQSGGTSTGEPTRH